MGEKYFPLYISMEGKRCLVLGGGRIAARRTKALLGFGALVWVAAPRICDDIRQYLLQYPGQCFLLEEEYKPGLVSQIGSGLRSFGETGSEAEPVSAAAGKGKMDFVLACTDDAQAQEAIYQECRELGVPVNLASDQSKCDFFFPALVEQENLVIGVCSGGRDHRGVRRTAQRLREWLAGESLK